MQVPLIGPVITKKHYTEMNLLSDEKNNFMFGHVLYDHGHDSTFWWNDHDHIWYDHGHDEDIQII